MIWLYRLLIPFGAILLAGGLYWTSVVIHEIASGRRNFDAGLEAALALVLVGGGIGLSLWAWRKVRQFRSLRIDRHILHLARSQSEIEVADIVSSEEMDLGPDEANECLQRLARKGIGSIGVSETGNTVFRLSVDDKETVWLD